MSKKKLMPSLRFEEFEGDETWKLYELGEVMSIVTDYVAAGSFADIAHNVKYETEPNYAQLVRTVDIKHKFKNNNFVYVDRTGFEFLWRVNLDKQSIILPNIGANIGEVYHITKSQLPYHRNVLGPNAILLKTDYNTPFMYNLFQTNTFQRNLKIIIASSGQPKFNKTELKQIEFFIPKKIEQEKIGKFFVRLDELIQLQQSKVNKVKDLKSAYLSEMFPKEGEKYPKRRFEGSTEPWYKNKFNEITEYITSSLSANNSLIKGRYELYDANELIGYTNSSGQKQEYVTIIKDGSGVGRVRLLPKDSNFIGTMGAIVNKEQTDIHYIYAYLQQFNFTEFITGATVPHVYYRDYGESTAYHPSYEEQVKIGKLFKNLDNQISIEEEKLAKLEKLKQSYLNDMFV